MRDSDPYATARGRVLQSIVPMFRRYELRRRTSALALWFIGFTACAVLPEASGPREQTQVRVIRVDPSASEAAVPSAGPESSARSRGLPRAEAAGATIAIEPAVALQPTAEVESILPIPSYLGAIRGVLFVFGRTRTGYLARPLVARSKTPGFGAAIWVTAAYPDDQPPVIIGDGDAVWFAVSSSTFGTRVARVEGASLQVVESSRIPSQLGTVAALVPMRAHVGVIGRDGDAITLARLDRHGSFLDHTAHVVARGSVSRTSTPSRSPRAVVEDDRILLAWDADDVPGALEAPGTTPAERLSPLPGVYVRRLGSNGEPISPVRRLTRPSFEAHTLDVAVELGACAVLASTADGAEMFRFVRKGDELAPYGGGLHLAGPGSDISLATDVIGTLAVTSTKLLRIGPGVKVVPSPLGFAPAPPATTFDRVQVATDGHFASAIFAAPTAFGSIATIARVDGERLAAPLTAPWVGPKPQQLLAVGFVRTGGVAVLAEDSKAPVVIQFSAEGKVQGSRTLPLPDAVLGALAWPNAAVPRFSRASEWVVGLRDGRALILSGQAAGTLVDVRPPQAPSGGYVAYGSDGSKARLLWIPPFGSLQALRTATLDPRSAQLSTWTELAETEHHYMPLGKQRRIALARADGGFWVLGNSGPRVPSVAQLHTLLAIEPTGLARVVPIGASATVTELALIPSTAGAALVASMGGIDVATRWLEVPTLAGWRTSFGYVPFLQKGDGPFVKSGGKNWLLPPGADAVEARALDDSWLDRCTESFATGPRSVLFVCEEAAPSALASTRVVLRKVSF